MSKRQVMDIALLAGVLMIVAAIVIDRVPVALGLMAIWGAVAIFADARSHPRSPDQSYLANLAARVEAGAEPRL
ncbi:hypothetical protein [Nocardia sp. NPDC020380]|uniref:hypothetical protein n=1 Tax=Nocardia sp. NPDC020380 TaxID=3364309 RepID=UPI0037ADE33B